MNLSLGHRCGHSLYQWMTLIVIVTFVNYGSTQGKDTRTNRDRFIISATKADEAIKVDGHLDEAAWSKSEMKTSFYNKWPSDSGFAIAQTKVRVLYDQQYLYISAVNDQKKEDLIIQSLRRDKMDAYWSSEAFSVVIDPINLRSNGFFFGVNAAGAQLDGSIGIQGPFSRLNENWDNKWLSATSIGEEQWTVEMAIPFSSLRFKESALEWGLNFIRNDLKNNVYSTWAPVSVQFPGFDLNSTGTLRWDSQAIRKTSKVTLIPYASLAAVEDREEAEPSKAVVNAGLDAKVAVSSSLNLDLTFRPDFSNVEVDQQMTNVTRFSLFFPEKRNFFLENADLFTNYGSWQVMPFFSRRIGSYDGQWLPISGGARLSGNLTKSLRVGVMDIQTRASGTVSPNNYFVTSLQQRLLARSSLKFFAANRQLTDKLEGDTQLDFNRTMGAEFQYVSNDGHGNLTARFHTAQTPEALDDHSYVSLQIGKSARKMYTGILVERVGENYLNDFGFVPRLNNYDPIRDTTVRIGHYLVNPWLGVRVFPKKSKKINVVELNTYSLINYRSNGSFLERNSSLNVDFSFKNTADLYAEAVQTDANVPFSVDILGNEKPIPVDRYRFVQYKVKYTTDSRRPFNAIASLAGGEFYNGTRVEYGLTLNARKQPWGTFGIGYLQNRISLPGQYGKADFLLIGPRSEISFANNIWWTTFVQYNTQAENLNINSRLQWRFKPMSDVFVCYTDNYTDTNMTLKNRSVVVKFIYWLNL